MVKKYLLWFIAIVYILSPFDLLPDWIFGAGWLDDLGILGLILWLTSRMKKGEKSRESSNYREHKDASENAQRVNPSHEDDPYKILGLNHGAQKEDIRKAYTKLAAQYHPDKVQHLGREFQELAHEKFIAIQKAYKTLIG
jgi:hypothetical protein